MRYVRFPGGAVGEIPDPPEMRIDDREEADPMIDSAPLPEEPPVCICFLARPCDCPVHGAASPLPEEPPELKEALEELSVACRSLGAINEATDTQDEYNKRWTRANRAYTAAVALFDRQREEKDKLLNALIDCGVNAGGYGLDGSIAVEVPRAVASLSAQLECAIKERKFAASSALLLDDQFKQVCAELESERSQLERLKAELLTPEEAQHALDQIPDNQCGWPPKDCPVCDSLREKLRCLSDTGAHP